MHKSAFINAQKFYNTYCVDNIESKTILDIGAWDGGNGSLRSIFNQGKYIGLDIQKGPNVDVVGDAKNIPFENNFFDIVISSSCFEHDPMFWLSFLEMCRVVKPYGFIYICHQAQAHIIQKNVQEIVGDFIQILGLHYVYGQNIINVK